MAAFSLSSRNLLSGLDVFLISTVASLELQCNSRSWKMLYLPTRHVEVVMLSHYEGQEKRHFLF